MNKNQLRNYKKINRGIAEWDKSKFCSWDCKYNYGRVRIKCVICKEDIVTTKSYSKKLKTCKNKACRSAYRKGYHTKERRQELKKGWIAEKNPRWKPI